MAKNLIALFEAICEAYDNPSFIPQNGTTHCNEAVAAIADAMGCKDLHLKTADEILASFEGNPDWSEIPMEKAQDIANQGSLIVAGVDSRCLKQAHGHVVVVRPGIPCFSGKWGLVPRVLNVGACNFLAKGKCGPLIAMPVGINESFIPMPTLWVWRPSL